MPNTKRRQHIKEALRKRRFQKGFTLVELMIVIALIGILAAIAIPQFHSYRVKGYNTKTKSELKGFHTVCAAYFTNAPDAVGCTVAEVATVFTPSNDVTITVISNARGNWSATAQHAALGAQLYTADVNGSITP